ncbi:MAG: hypothetical protein JRJ64_15305 [Deltaproteobacteria bacterium]|nr:hypothetical protein [Deltaproteobacteria bacterium]
MSPWNHHFRRLLKRTGLRDSSQGRGVQPTWPTHNPLLRIPIDHCLHSEGIHVVQKKIGPAVGSDHYPVIVDFTMATEDTEALVVCDSEDELRGGVSLLRSCPTNGEVTSTAG